MYVQSFQALKLLETDESFIFHTQEKKTMVKEEGGAGERGQREKNLEDEFLLSEARGKVLFVVGLYSIHNIVIQI